MKKTTSVAIGKRNFTLDEDAYDLLGRYLDDFRKDLARKGGAASSNEVMEEVEMRVADLFREKLGGREVVDEGMVKEVIAQLGLPEGESFSTESGRRSDAAGDAQTEYDRRRNRKLYRDTERRVLGGVCSGLAYYFDVDVVLLRVLFVVAFILCLAGFWVYIIFWIITPSAYSATEKCEMRGIPANADNIASFSK